MGGFFLFAALLLFIQLHLTPFVYDFPNDLSFTPAGMSGQTVYQSLLGWAEKVADEHFILSAINGLIMLPDKF